MLIVLGWVVGYNQLQYLKVMKNFSSKSKSVEICMAFAIFCRGSSIPFSLPFSGNKDSLRVFSTKSSPTQCKKYCLLFSLVGITCPGKAAKAGCHTFCSSNPLRSFSSHVLSPASFIHSSFRFIYQVNSHEFCFRHWHN